MGAAPGGMERHAHTLYTALARRGHMVHVFTSPLDSVRKEVKSILEGGSGDPVIHCHEGEPGSKWRYNKAWEQFEEENRDEPFDVVHSESVALPHWLARGLPNLAVTWHGIVSRIEILETKKIIFMGRKKNVLKLARIAI